MGGRHPKQSKSLVPEHSLVCVLLPGNRGPKVILAHHPPERSLLGGDLDGPGHLGRGKVGIKPLLFL